MKQPPPPTPPTPPMLGLVETLFTVALFSARLGSDASLLTCAVFANGPIVLSCCSVIVTVVVAPTASVPNAQVSGNPELHVPWLGMAETRLVLSGRESPSVTFAAALGPALLTVIVQVIDC